MPILVNPKTCIGCGTCVALAPKNFQLNPDTNLADVIDQKVTTDTKSAQNSCPVDAISIK